MQKTFVTYLLYEHSQYAAFDRPNKTEMMIITLGKSVAMGDLKISKTDVKPGFHQIVMQSWNRAIQECFDYLLKD